MRGAGGRGYELGSGDAELDRLDLQGRALAPATRMLLEAAGIRPGMRVLDLGSGAGDVSFVAADLVGPAGRVTGIDRSPEALTRATARAQARGLAHVRFIEGDIHDAAPGGPFDAVIGRLVLMYVTDPAAVLRTQVSVLRPGGLVAPIEFDMSTARASPATPLLDQAIGWVAEAFRRCGIHTSLGRDLWQVLLDAGLHPAGMLGVQPCFGPDDPDGAALVAGIVTTALPLIERMGVATRDEMAVDTLSQRLTAAEATFTHPVLLSAWATTSAPE